MFMIPKENLFLHETHSEMQGSPPTRATRSASFGPLASIDPSAPASSSPSVTTGHHFGGCGGGGQAVQIVSNRLALPYKTQQKPDASFLTG